MDRLTIIKVGGKVCRRTGIARCFIRSVQKDFGEQTIGTRRRPNSHSGCRETGIETKMVDGRRITDSDMLEVVTMVYGGLVNKKIVAALQARGVNAVGLTGADFNLIEAHKRPVKEIDYGFVGDVDDVNVYELKMLIGENVVPVIAPLTHDGKGQLLNTNADTIASELATELARYFNVYLFYCFEKKVYCAPLKMKAQLFTI